MLAMNILMLDFVRKSSDSLRLRNFPRAYPIDRMHPCFISNCFSGL